MVNPGTVPISVQAEFRKVDATIFGHAAFTVAPHSMLIVPRAIQTALIPGPAATPVGRGAAQTIYLQAAITGIFRSSGPFYVLAAVANNDISNVGKDAINRFAMIQPEPLE